ncbi:DUF1428 domain-containing protein [Tsuneonella sp. HG222]
MYLQGFIVPVPAEKQDAYRDMAEKFWPIAHDNGAIEHVEAWEADVSDGKQTDFRRAVALEDGEKVVFSWVAWPDKATADASNEKLMNDPRMDEMGKDMPFDSTRMVYGGFEPFLDEGVSRGGGYVDGFVAPVPDENREAYVKMATDAAKVFLDHGALRDVEAWGSGIELGKVTSFPRSVEAKEGESVVFSFVEWPDEATRKAGWEKIMADERMNGVDMPFDGKRMYWGGFVPIVDRGR